MSRQRLADEELFMRCYNSCYIESKPVFKHVEELDLPVIVFNAETTGLDHTRDQIIQLAAVKCRLTDDRLIPVRSYNGFAKPVNGTTEFVEKFTGKNAGFWNSQQSLDSLMHDARELFGPAPVVMSWSASDFATPFLLNTGFVTGHMIYPIASIDLFRVAQSVSPKNRDYDNFSLRMVAEKEGIKILHKDEGHDARYDVNAYIELFNRFYPLFRTGKDAVSIQSVKYYEKSVYVQRLYFTTDHGTFYIDGNTGYICEETIGFLDHVDADALTQKLLLGYHAKDLKEVVRKYYIKHHQKS